MTFYILEIDEYGKQTKTFFTSVYFKKAILEMRQYKKENPNRKYFVGEE